MDEEDIADAEETKTLQTSNSFSGLGSTETELSQRDAFMDVLRPSDDTVGVKLLRKMGWREGQGVGPRARRKARLEDGEDQEVSAAQETHLFAPENSKMISFIRKNDHKGLGFEGEGRLRECTQGERIPDTPNEDDNDDDDAPTLTIKPKKKKPTVQRGGFGVGVLNDTGSDDEDPYHMGPQISYNRVIGGDKKKKKKTLDNGKPSVASSNPLLRSKPVFMSKKATSKSPAGFRRCHDGRLPLDGFVLSSLSDSLSSLLTQDTKYPPPTIPKDWKSSRMPSDKTSSTTTNPDYQSSADLARASTLNATSRASVLGETALPGKSVFDYISSSARSRLVAVTNNPNLPAAGNQAPPPGYIPKQPMDILALIPPLDSATAITALGRGIGGWMPYAEDPAKRARYRSFLEYRAGLKEETPERVKNMSTDAWIAEMKEFAHAAQVFKPMSGVMASRFVSSSSAPTPPKTELRPNNNSAGNSNSNEPSFLSQPTSKPLANPAEEAARLGMFGPLTRSSETFFPTRLLCKRFNIPPPVHVQPDNDTASSSFSTASEGGGGVPNASNRFVSSGFQTTDQTPKQQPKETPKVKDIALVGKKDVEIMMRERREIMGTVEGKEEEETGERESGARRLEVDPERNEALERERPGDAVFRAIFGSESEGEGDD